MLGDIPERKIIYFVHTKACLYDKVNGMQHGREWAHKAKLNAALAGTLSVGQRAWSRVVDNQIFRFQMWQNWVVRLCLRLRWSVSMMKLKSMISPSWTGTKLASVDMRREHQ